MYFGLKQEPDLENHMAQPYQIKFCEVLFPSPQNCSIQGLICMLGAFHVGFNVGYTENLCMGFQIAQPSGTRLWSLVSRLKG